MKIKVKNLRHPHSLFVVLIFVFLFNFFSTGKVIAEDTEIIRNFNDEITINKDGTTKVQENITYDFGQNQKHGIFRTIPLTSKDGTQIQVVEESITDETGNSYPFKID